MIADMRVFAADDAAMPLFLLPRHAAAASLYAAVSLVYTLFDAARDAIVAAMPPLQLFSFHFDGR